MTTYPRKGPLQGLRVIEFAGIGPGPHAAMLLANLGAEVLRIERIGGNGYPNPVVDCGGSPLTLDIRTDEGRRRCLEVAELADVAIEGNRPGVMERLGLGPDDLMAANPRLIYARMTGWGQTGPLSRVAGHDINYIALTGALAAMGQPGEPARPPLNLVGDFGGGSLYLVMGVLAALFERERSGLGQVIDAAIVDGVTSLMTFFAGLLPSGFVSLDQERNFLGGAAPFYRCYTCSDGKDVAIGAIEPKFYAELLDKICADKSLLDRQHDQSKWAEDSTTLAALFATKTRGEWCAILESTDACFAPVLTLEESAGHFHMKERNIYVDGHDCFHAAPAPRFSRTPGEIVQAPSADALLKYWQANTCP